MKYIITVFVFLLSMQLSAQSYWTEMRETTANKNNKERWIVPEKYRPIAMDVAGFKKSLAHISFKNSTTEVEITIPMPNGNNERYVVSSSPIMHPDLAAKFPEITTYKGHAKHDRSAKIYLDMTSAGFHAMILCSTGSVFIDPYFKKDNSKYVSYYKKDHRSGSKSAWSCGTENEVEFSTFDDPVM